MLKGVTTVTNSAYARCKVATGLSYLTTDGLGQMHLMHREVSLLSRGWKKGPSHQHRLSSPPLVPCHAAREGTRMPGWLLSWSGGTVAEPCRVRNLAGLLRPPRQDLAGGQAFSL